MPKKPTVVKLNDIMFVPMEEVRDEFTRVFDYAERMTLNYVGAPHSTRHRYCETCQAWKKFHEMKRQAFKLIETGESPKEQSRLEAKEESVDFIGSIAKTEG